MNIYRRETIETRNSLFPNPSPARNPAHLSMSFDFFSRDPNLTPPLPDSEPLDDTLQERSLTPEFPSPPSPISNKIIFQDRMESNSQRLYPQLDSPSPPPPPEEQKATLSRFPLSHFTPPPPPPADYFQTTPIPMPQMEHNPLYNPDPLRTELLLTSPIPPLVMNSLTQQILLAQQQALNQHFSTNIPLNQQIHPNVLSGFQNFPSPHLMNISPSFGHLSDAQYNTSEHFNGDDGEGLAEWKKDLISKEKRILKEKYGDNHMNVFTTEHQVKQSYQFQTDGCETENLSPAPPFPNSPLEYSTEERMEREETPRDRIVYPSLNSNSSDEDSHPLNNQPIKSNILPGFISRLRNANSTTQTNSQEWIIPPSEASYSSPIPLPPVYPDNLPMDTQNTSLPHHCPAVITPPPYKPKNSPQTEIIQNRTILFPPELNHTSNEVSPRPILKPPSLGLTPSREIKRPPTHNKPTKREISYPPGLEPNTSPKKKVIYPPNAGKRIIYPPKNEITRPPVFLNKTCTLDTNNDISYSGEREILYPHSWTEPPTLSPSNSPKQIHYPPKQPIILDTDLSSIDSIPVIPREEPTKDRDITPPIIDSSGEEDDTLVTSRPLQSTPKKSPLPPHTEDKPDSESENAGFETPTDID